MSEPEFESREQWRRRNIRILQLVRGLVVGLIMVAIFWFVYRVLR